MRKLDEEYFREVRNSKDGATDGVEKEVSPIANVRLSSNATFHVVTVRYEECTLCSLREQVSSTTLSIFGRPLLSKALLA